MNVPLSRAVIAEFHAAHAQRYGYSHPEREVELVTLRLRGTVRSPQAKIAARGEAAPVGPGATRQRTRLGKGCTTENSPMVFDGKQIETAIYERDRLKVGIRYPGPAVIAEYSATTIVPPGARFWHDRAGNLNIEWK